MSFKIKEKFNFPKINNMIYVGRIIGSDINMQYVEKSINEYLLDGKDNKFDIIDQKIKNLNENNIYETLKLIDDAIDFSDTHIHQGYTNGASEHIRSIFNQALKRKIILLEKVKSLKITK